MNPTPIIVVVSSSSTKPKSLIKLITRSKNAEGELDETNVFSKKWELDTKYYIAEVNLVGITDDYKRSEEFNENVEALIVHMDSNKTTGLEDLKKYESFENDCNPEIKLLIANYCTAETKITRNAALEWCSKHGYELIELFPSKTPETATRSRLQPTILEEKTGADRIVEALQVHVWPNLIMKTDDAKSSKTEKKYTVEEGLDEFSDLLKKLNTMKESIQTMPTEQRRHCAEQMVTAFWRAIGGDEEEIADL